MLEDKTKKYFFYLNFNMLSFLFLVVLETCCCIVLLGYEFSEIGDQDFSNIGGFGKVGGLIQSRGCNPLHTIERH